MTIRAGSVSDGFLNTVAYASGSDLTVPGCVTKPRFGAGSAGVKLAAPNDCLLSSVLLGELIVQPFIPGRAASAAFLIGARESCSLPPAEQFLSSDGNFRYLGGRLPLPEPFADRAIRIASRAISCVPGLNGYVGVDVILGGPADGSGDFAIEINPRLTTSYIGLRAACEDNLMDLLLRLVRGESISEPRWRREGVTWTSDGEIRRLSLSADGRCTLSEAIARIYGGRCEPDAQRGFVGKPSLARRAHKSLVRPK